jgi:uncharacterized paraquat-inducible protein A
MSEFPYVILAGMVMISVSALPLGVVLLCLWLVGLTECPHSLS